MHCTRAEFERIPTGLRRLRRDVGHAIGRKEPEQLGTRNRPLGNDPVPFQEAGVPVIESNHPGHDFLDEAPCV